MFALPDSWVWDFWFADDDLGTVPFRASHTRRADDSNTLPGGR